MARRNKFTRVGGVKINARKTAGQVAEQMNRIRNTSQDTRISDNTYNRAFHTNARVMNGGGFYNRFSRSGEPTIVTNTPNARFATANG